MSVDLLELKCVGARQRGGEATARTVEPFDMGEVYRRWRTLLDEMYKDTTQ